MRLHGSLPIARTVDLIVTEVGEDLIVYDEVSSQFHLLERDAAAVWRAADGRRTIDELAVAGGIASAEVAAILDRLSGVRLLVSASRMTRRQALKRVGLAAGVISMLAPVAAAAQSTTCVPFNACTTQRWGQTCCPTTSGTTCARDLIDGSFACFPNQFCADPDFWQVDCFPGGSRFVQRKIGGPRPPR